MQKFQADSFYKSKVMAEVGNLDVYGTPYGKSGHILS